MTRALLAVAAVSALAWGASAGQARAQDAPEEAQPAEQVLIYHGEAASILGRSVRDSGDNVVGRIVDVLVDDRGQPRAAVVEVGGFMGLGSRRVAVSWSVLKFLPASGAAGRIRLDLSLDQIKDIPEFKRSATTADPPTAVAVPPPPRPDARREGAFPAQ